MWKGGQVWGCGGCASGVAQEEGCAQAGVHAAQFGKPVVQQQHLQATASTAQSSTRISVKIDPYPNPELPELQNGPTNNIVHDQHVPRRIGAQVIVIAFMEAQQECRTGWIGSCVEGHDDVTAAGA